MEKEINCENGKIGDGTTNPKERLVIKGNGNVGLKEQEPSIIFNATSPDAGEVIRITKGKFYWKGEEVEDKYQVYERFNEWLTMAEKK